MADKVPFALKPDVRTEPAKGPLKELPTKRQPFSGTTSVARTMVSAKTVGPQLKVGPVELQLLGVEVKKRGENALEVVAALRFRDKVGRAHIDTEDGRCFPFELQVQRRAPRAQDDPNRVRGYYRSCSVALTTITADPTTGVWSDMTFELLRYDEQQHVPSIKWSKPGITLDVERPADLKLDRVTAPPAKKAKQ